MVRISSITYPSSKIVSLGIVQIPEGRQLFPTLTVVENLEMGSQFPKAKKVRKETMQWLLVRDGQTRSRAFLAGQSTGVVEPAAAVLGAVLIASSVALLPYGLAFAAGAMVFVVIEELVPECQRSGHADSAVLAAIIRFTLMIVLDIALA